MNLPVLKHLECLGMAVMMNRNRSRAVLPPDFYILSCKSSLVVKYRRTAYEPKSGKLSG
eukprot:c19830_g1_i1 orf=2-175(-)